MTLTLVSARRDARPTTSFVTWLVSDRGVAPSTARAYAGDVTRLGLTHDTPGPAHRRVAQNILDAPLAASTRSRRLAAASQFFTFTHPADASNPYRTVRRPRTGVVLPTVVTTPEQGRMTVEWLAAEGSVRAFEYAAVVALMAGSGLRVGEVVTLTWGDVDVERGCVRATGKGDKTRDVPVGEYASQAVRWLYDALCTTARPPRATDRVVTVGVRSIQRKIAEAGKALGVRGLHPHAFRHGFATAVYDGTKDLLLTSELLGHANIQTTRVYTHLSDARRNEAAAFAL